MGADDIFESLLSNVPVNGPGGEDMPLLEDFFDFFKGSSNGFGEHEEDVDEGGKVEGTEDEVSLPGNGVETRRDSVCEREVEEPVGGCRD
jgi:hypothetical protein